MRLGSVCTFSDVTEHTSGNQDQNFRAGRYGMRSTLEVTLHQVPGCLVQGSCPLAMKS